MLGFALKNLLMHFLELTMTFILLGLVLFSFIMNGSAFACDFIISLNKGAFRKQKWKQISWKVDVASTVQIFYYSIWLGFIVSPHFNFMAKGNKEFLDFFGILHLYAIPVYLSCTTAGQMQICQAQR